jgi:DNA invertase Pin-like site-specific DNA recombinase
VTRAVLYARVSTREQADNGGGLDAQVAAGLARYPEAEVVRERGSGARADTRPLFMAAVAGMRAGDTLVAARLDRLGRSTRDILDLADRGRREGWALVALDLGMDTSTPAGEFCLTVMAAVARLERRMIGERTRDGMAAKKAAGTLRGPVGRRVGDPRNVGGRAGRAAAA